jgi:hypothetical protein
MSILSSSYSDKFIREGIVVIPFDKVLGGSLSFISTVAKIVKDKNLDKRANLEDGENLPPLVRRVGRSHLIAQGDFTSFTSRR